MTGSLQIKKSMYYAVLRIPDGRGVEKQRWISTGISVEGNNKRKAQQRLREIVAEFEEQYASGIFDSKKIEFTEWIWQWMAQKKNEVRQNTYESYELVLKAHIEPYFKPRDLSLASIKPQHIQQYYNSKGSGDESRPGLSAHTIRKHHVIILGALKSAVLNDMIPYNPAERVSLPKKKRYTGQFYTKEQADKLLSVLDGEPMAGA